MSSDGEQVRSGHMNNAFCVSAPTFTWCATRAATSSSVCCDGVFSCDDDCAYSHAHTCARSNTHLQDLTLQMTSASIAESAAAPADVYNPSQVSEQDFLQAAATEFLYSQLALRHGNEPGKVYWYLLVRPS